MIAIAEVADGGLAGASSSITMMPPEPCCGGLTPEAASGGARGLGADPETEASGAWAGALTEGDSTTITGISLPPRMAFNNDSLRMRASRSDKNPVSLSHCLTWAGDGGGSLGT
eukprot:11069140-Alexandrium_andersonii.AAC.1